MFSFYKRIFYGRHWIELLI